MGEKRVGARSSESFGPFLIFERLGTGGMAVVHRAIRREDDGNEREVALKRLLPHLAEDAAFIRAFAREAKMAQRLRHRNICGIHELGRVGDQYFISMEYLDGCDLRALLRRAHARGGPAPIPVVLSILAQLCAALDHAHTAVDEETGEPLGLVHRDVSPANILVTRTGAVKVIDFGIAKATLAKFRTETGRFRGKLGYLAPEAIQGQQLDGRSDLFSLGVIAYELVTAKPLFGAVSDFDTLSRVQFGQVEPPSSISPICPLELDAIVMTALAKDPADRWQSAAAMRSAVLEVASMVGGMPPAAVIADWVRSALEDTPVRGALEVGLAATRLDPGTEQVVELVWGSDSSGEHVPLDIPDLATLAPRRDTGSSALVVPLEDDAPAARGIRRLPRAGQEDASQGTRSMWKLKRKAGGKRANRLSTAPVVVPPVAPAAARAFVVPSPAAAVPPPAEGDDANRLDTAALEELSAIDTDPGDGSAGEEMVSDTIQMDALSREQIMVVGPEAGVIGDAGGVEPARVDHLMRDPADFETVQIDRLEQVTAASETVKAPVLARPPSPPVVVPVVAPVVAPPAAVIIWYRRWDALQLVVATMLLLLAPSPGRAAAHGTREPRPASPLASQKSILAADMSAAACRVVVSSKPSTATVWLDDRVIGRTPLEMSIECRGGLLSVEKEGFHTGIRKLSFEDGKREARVAVDLDRKPH